MNPTIRRALWPTVTMLAGAWAGDIVCAHVRARFAAGDDANRIINTWTAAFRNPTPSLDQTDLACGLIIAAMIGLAWLYHWARKGNYRTGEEYGSARWATPRDMAPYTDPDPSHNLQMTATEGISIDTHTTGRNTNVTAIGSSGSGKSHYYVLPNLLANHNLNWAVTDPKGELHDTARASLEANGYQVKLLDLANLSEASHFNPLAYIDPDQPDTAIMRLVTNIMDNTEQAGARTQQSGNDGFWTKAERSLLTALTALVYHTDDHPNLNKVADLALKMEASEEDETMRSDVDILMECAEQLADQVQAHPQEWDEEARATAEGLRFAVSQYRPFTQGAGETKKSVIISLGVRLAPMQVGAVRHILESDDIGIDQYTQGASFSYLICVHQCFFMCEYGIMVGMDSMRTYTLGEFSRLTGKATSTLQRWDRTGVLTAHRTVTNRRYYTYDQYLSVMGLPPQLETEQDKRIVIYARVSSRNQRDDLANQERFLRQWANARGLIVDEVLTDIGSGMNFKRKNFNRIMYADDISRVIIAHKDRLTRFGYDWFADYLHHRGVTVTVVNNDQLSPQEELVQDLVSIIHVFSSRIYGLRRYAKEVRDDESLPHGTQPHTKAG